MFLDNLIRLNINLTLLFTKGV